MIYYGLLLFFLLEYVRPATFVPGLALLRLNSSCGQRCAGCTDEQGPSVLLDALNAPNTRMVVGILGLVVLSVLTADVTLYAFNVFTAVIG